MALLSCFLFCFFLTVLNGMQRNQRKKNSGSMVSENQGIIYPGMTEELSHRISFDQSTVYINIVAGGFIMVSNRSLQLVIHHNLQYSAVFNQHGCF